MSGSDQKYRKPQHKRAKLVTATGEVDAEGRPLPSDPTKPKTLLTLEEIYAIAREGDRIVMRDYGELFITTGTNAFETKSEYAWIYLRRNDSGQLPISEGRLKALFPEWDLVLNPREDNPLASHQSESMAGSLKIEEDEFVSGRRGLNSSVVDRRLDGIMETRGTRSSAELRKQVLDLRNENEDLQREVRFLRNENRQKLSELQRVWSQSHMFTGSPEHASGKRTSEMAFGHAGGYALGFSERTLPNLHSSYERTSSATHQSNLTDEPYHGNWGYGEQSPHGQMKRMEIFDQQKDMGNGPFNQVSRCIPEEARSRILSSLSSEDDMDKLKLHGYGHFKPYRIQNAPSFGAGSFLINDMSMDNPFLSTEAHRPFQVQGVNLGALLPEYPPLDDQFDADSQLLLELQSSQANESCVVKAPTSSLTKPRSTESTDALIDPLFSELSSQPEFSQELISMMNIHSSPTEPSPMQAKLESPSPEGSPDNQSKGGFKLSRRSIAAMKHPKLANDPICKFVEDLDSLPPGLPKKYGNFKVQRDLPAHLQQPQPDQQTLTDEDLRLLLDFGPTVRGLFAKYFRRRDGFIKPQYRYLLDEVDPVTGGFKLPALQIYSIDPQMVPHYINRHYPEFRLRESPLRRRGQVASSELKAEEAEEVEKVEEGEAVRDDDVNE
jgi:hypothetical protein